jgi:hypothetical protein
MMGRAAGASRLLTFRNSAHDTLLTTTGETPAPCFRLICPSTNQTAPACPRAGAFPRQPRQARSDRPISGLRQTPRPSRVAKADGPGRAPLEPCLSGPDRKSGAHCDIHPRQAARSASVRSETPPSTSMPIGADRPGWAPLSPCPEGPVRKTGTPRETRLRQARRSPDIRLRQPPRPSRQWKASDPLASCQCPASQAESARPSHGTHPIQGAPGDHLTSSPRHPLRRQPANPAARPSRPVGPIQPPNSVPGKRPATPTSAQRQLARSLRQGGPADRPQRRARPADPLRPPGPASGANFCPNSTLTGRPDRTTPTKPILNDSFNSMNDFGFNDIYQILDIDFTRETPPSFAPPAAQAHPKSPRT